MVLLAQFKVPGASGSEALPVPSGIPSALTGGLDTTGQSFIQLILNYGFLIGAVIAVVMIIYSGMQWITSGGDTAKISAARSRLIYAIIGLVVIGLAFIIVRVVITTVGAKPQTFINIK